MIIIWIYLNYGVIQSYNQRIWNMQWIGWVPLKQHLELSLCIFIVTPVWIWFRRFKYIASRIKPTKKNAKKKQLFFELCSMCSIKDEIPLCSICFMVHLHVSIMISPTRQRVADRCLLPRCRSRSLRLRWWNCCPVMGWSKKQVIYWYGYSSQVSLNSYCISWLYTVYIYTLYIYIHIYILYNIYIYAIDKPTIVKQIYIYIYDIDIQFVYQ
jgi:hypothetical protein